MESGRRKIIVADESHAFVMNMSILLKRMGFSVIPAENSEEVIRLMKIMHADLAMLDATLQDDEGFAVLRRIRKGFWTRKLPVIMFIPRENATRYLEQCEEFGATGHLMKPVNIIELHEVLQECLFVPKGITRRFMRTEYRDRIELSIGDQALEAYTVSLSEGGIYIRTSEPLPEGTRVSLNLPIREDRSLAVRGTVLYTKGLFGDIMKLPPGMAIGFENISPEDIRRLRCHIQERLACDLTESSGEKVIEIDMEDEDACNQERT